MRAPALQIIEHSMRIHSAKCMIHVKYITCYTLRHMSIDTAAIRWRQRAGNAVTDNIDSAAAGSRRRQAPAGAAVWATGTNFQQQVGCASDRMLADRNLVLCGSCSSAR